MQNALVNRIGLASAVVTTLAATGFVVLMGLEFVTGRFSPTSFTPPEGLLPMLVLNLVLAVSFVVLATSIHYSAPAEDQVLSFLGVAFAIAFTAVDSTVFYTQLTLVVPHLLRGEAAAVSAHTFNPGSFQWATEFWGCTLLSVSAAFLGPVFRRVGFERWIRWGLMITGVMAVPIALSVSVPWFWFNVVPLWGLSLPASTALLAVHFWRRLRAPLGRE